jgi:hypothetical protein
MNVIRSGTTGLTTGQRRQFEVDGFVVLDVVLSEEELVSLRAEADRILELVINTSVASGRRDPRLDIYPLGEKRAAVRKVQPVNDLSASIGALSTDPRLTGPMAELMGDRPVLMEEKLNYKQVIDGGDLDMSVFERAGLEDRAEALFELHHDWGYYRVNGYPETTLSSAVALDDCAGRGPIRVVPGSHLLDVPLADPGSSSGVVEAGALGADPALLPLDLTAGSVVIFHSKLVHDSEANPSGQPRRLMIYSHYPASHGDGQDADRRNRPTREAASSMEDAYIRSLDNGARPAFRVHRPGG